MIDDEDVVKVNFEFNDDEDNLIEIYFDQQNEEVRDNEQNDEKSEVEAGTQAQRDNHIDEYVADEDHIDDDILREDWEREQDVGKQSAQTTTNQKVSKDMTDFDLDSDEAKLPEKQAEDHADAQLKAKAKADALLVKKAKALLLHFNKDNA